MLEKIVFLDSSEWKRTGLIGKVLVVNTKMYTKLYHGASVIQCKGKLFTKVQKKIGWFLYLNAKGIINLLTMVRDHGWLGLITYESRGLQNHNSGRYQLWRSRHWSHKIFDGASGEMDILIENRTGIHGAETGEVWSLYWDIHKGEEEAEGC